MALSVQSLPLVLNAQIIAHLTFSCQQPPRSLFRERTGIGEQFNHVSDYGNERFTKTSSRMALSRAWFAAEESVTLLTS